MVFLLQGRNKDLQGLSMYYVGTTFTFQMQI